jgi:translocation and assembly module TamB
MRLPRLRKFCLVFLMALSGVLILVFLILNLPPSQRFATGKVNQALKHSGLPIYLEDIRKIMPGSVKIQGLVIMDLHGDTIVYAAGLRADIRMLALLHSKVLIKDLNLEGALVDIVRERDGQNLNLAEAFQSGKKQDAGSVEKGSSGWEIFIRKGKLSSISFGMSDSKSGIHMSLSISKLSLKALRISLNERDIRCKALDLNGAEGVMKMAPSMIAEKAKTGSSWNMELLDLGLKDIGFNLQQEAVSLNLEAHIGEGSMLANEMDLLSKIIDLRRFSLSEASITLDVGDRKPKSSESKEIMESDFQWSILSEYIELANASLILGSEPAEVFSGIDLNIKDFRLDDQEAGMKLRKMNLDMANGFSLKKVKGVLDSEGDQVALHLELETGNSRIEVGGAAETGILNIMKHPGSISGASLDFNHSQISLKDVFCFESDLKESAMLCILAQSTIDLEGLMKLNESMLSLADIFVFQKSNFQVDLNGRIENPFQIHDSKADLDMELSGINSPWFYSLLGNSGREGSFSDLTDLHIQAQISDSLMSPRLGVSLKSHLGAVDLKGSLDIQKEHFKMAYALNKVSLGELLSISHMGLFSGSGEVKGTGFSAEYMDAGILLQIDTLVFREFNYSRVQLTGRMKPGEYELRMVANDSSLKADLDIVLNLADSVYRVNAEGSVMVQLHHLHLYDEPLTVETDLEAQFIGREKKLESELSFNGLKFTGLQESSRIEQLKASFKSDTVETLLRTDADFFNIDMQISLPFESLDSLGTAYKSYLASFNDPSYIIAADRVSALPAITASGQMTYHSILDVLMKDSGLYFSNLDFSLTHPPGENRLKASIRGEKISYNLAETGTLKAALSDSAGIILFNLTSDQTSFNSGPENNLSLSGNFSNRSTLATLSVYDSVNQDVYHVQVSGKVDSNQIVLEIPSREIILMREKWKMEQADLLSINLENNRVIPGFQMSRDSASMQISALNQDQAIIYNIALNQFELGSLVRTNFIPGEPDGTFGGSIELSAGMDSIRKIKTQMKISDISYFGENLRDIYLDGSLIRSLGEEYSIDFLLKSDSSDILVKGGQGENGDRRIDASFSHFPLIGLQAFTRDYLSDLGGVVSGNFNFSSRDESEQFNGEVRFDDARLRVNMLNSSFRIPNQGIEIKKDRLSFNKFTILDTLNKALILDGYLDFGRDKPLSVALNISSSKLQLMSRDRESKESFSGNVFVDSKFSVNGPLRQAVVEGKLILAEGTELYYQHKEDLSMSESEKIVSFVQAASSDEAISAPSMRQERRLINSSVGTIVEINPATKINFTLAKRMFEIDLNVTGGGELQYNLTENAQSTLSGKYEIGEGAAFLKLVGWPNKTFTIARGAYIRWDGMIENPELRIEAENRVSSSYINPVDNKRRDVAFEVILQTSGYLSDLDVNFTIRTPDQYVMSIINTMSPDEQMRQAIQVLLFETIDLPGISSSSDYMTQQVNQILASQLNQLTKSAIKGVDISFGLDSYSESSQGGEGGTTTSLSYEVKKSLLNNRAQIEVSGRLHDANQQAGTSEHSMNNLSFEYRLDSAASKYLKVYNEHSYDDVFEGEVTKTGIGFTYRKRYRTLSDIWRRKK